MRVRVRVRVRARVGVRLMMTVRVRVRVRLRLGLKVAESAGLHSAARSRPSPSRPRALVGPVGRSLPARRTVARVATTETEKPLYVVPLALLITNGPLAVARPRRVLGPSCWPRGALLARAPYRRSRRHDENREAALRCPPRAALHERPAIFVLSRSLAVAAVLAAGHISVAACIRTTTTTATTTYIRGH